jgi:acetyltransferase-like isoleucine patch superfamily enzyme
VVDSRHEIAGERDGNAQTPLETWAIEVADGVWVSSKTTIASSVGFGSVIGAHSFVSKLIEAYTLAVGTPARVKKMLDGHGHSRGRRVGTSFRPAGARREAALSSG